MRRSLQSLPTPPLVGANRPRTYSSTVACSALRRVNIIFSEFEHLRTEEFRCKAFIPQLPVLITTSVDPTVNTATTSGVPATGRWFSVQTRTGDGTFPSFRYKLQRSYLGLYGDTILPYELSRPPMSCAGGETLSKDAERGFWKSIGPELVARTFPGLVSRHVLGTLQSNSTFYTFQAPLDLLLQASRSIEDAENTTQDRGNIPGTPQLYVAQARISELPQQLQDDLPVPRLVKEAGRGDIYDANIWLGIPPTYTPLHRDPNPNLFIQLASNKVVRIFSPDIGGGIFREVQQKIGGNATSTLRGDEMMQGPEKMHLEGAVWNPRVTDGYEVVVRPGDALFIPKGWWHSIKSTGLDINASVNWWFR